MSYFRTFFHILVLIFVTLFVLSQHKYEAALAPALTGPSEVSERAVLIYPQEKEIGRGAVFYTLYQLGIIRDVSRNFDTTVRTFVRTNKEFFSINVDGAKLIIISGHGNKTLLSFGFDGDTCQCLDPPKCSLRNYIDIRDEAQITKWLSRTDPHALIVLQSCLTGSYNGLAQAFKRAAGENRVIIAASDEVFYAGLNISFDPLDAKFTCVSGRWSIKSFPCTVRY